MAFLYKKLINVRTLRKKTAAEVVIIRRRYFTLMLEKFQKILKTFACLDSKRFRKRQSEDIRRCDVCSFGVNGAAGYCWRDNLSYSPHRYLVFSRIFGLFRIRCFSGKYIQHFDFFLFLNYFFYTYNLIKIALLHLQICHCAGNLKSALTV